MRSSLLSLLCIVALSGCATIFSGTDDDITFRSEPPGAQVIIDDIAVGTTPTTVEVDRPGFGDTDVTVQLDGYEPRTFELDKEFNNTSIINLLIWPGFIIDALTGAIYKYDKKTYLVDLSSGTISLNLDELPRGAKGQYLLPDSDKPIAVTDDDIGVILLFR